MAQKLRNGIFGLVDSFQLSTREQRTFESLVLKSFPKIEYKRSSDVHKVLFLGLSIKLYFFSLETHRSSAESSGKSD